MLRWIMAAIAVVLLITGLAWLTWYHAPMREIERSRAALAKAKSWHFHTVHVFPGSAPETMDEDTLCPDFRYTVTSGTDREGTTMVREGIDYTGQQYGRTGDQWLPVKGAAHVDLLECERGPLAGDENSLPFESFLEDGTVRRGSIQEVENESCREYEVRAPTPHDPQEKEFRFSVCINEHDHLPRQTRRTPPGSDHEGVSVFTQWNVLTEPRLPAGFPKS